MTVEQLIKELEKFPPSAEVQIWDYEYDCTQEFTGVAPFRFGRNGIGVKTSYADATIAMLDRHIEDEED